MSMVVVCGVRVGHNQQAIVEAWTGGVTTVMGLMEATGLSKRQVLSSMCGLVDKGFFNVVDGPILSPVVEAVEMVEEMTDEQYDALMELVDEKLEEFKDNLFEFLGDKDISDADYDFLVNQEAGRLESMLFNGKTEEEVGPAVMEIVEPVEEEEQSQGFVMLFNDSDEGKTPHQIKMEAVTTYAGIMNLRNKWDTEYLDIQEVIEDMFNEYCEDEKPRTKEFMGILLNRAIEMLLDAPVEEVVNLTQPNVLSRAFGNMDDHLHENMDSYPEYLLQNVNGYVYTHLWGAYGELIGEEAKRLMKEQEAAEGHGYGADYDELRENIQFYYDHDRLAAERLDEDSIPRGYRLSVIVAEVPTSSSSSPGGYEEYCEQMYMEQVAPSYRALHKAYMVEKEVVVEAQVQAQVEAVGSIDNLKENEVINPFTGQVEVLMSEEEILQRYQTSKATVPHVPVPTKEQACDPDWYLENGVNPFA